MSDSVVSNGTIAPGAQDRYHYAAFISYRHTDPDRRWAKWLHQALETYRVPRRLSKEKGVPRRIGRCFRDEEELPASADLSREIDSALEQSRFLIVICSPRTPASQWVNQEVLRFRQLGRHDRILALLIEGEPRVSFPQALVEIRRTAADEHGPGDVQVEAVEPLAADVRATRTDERGNLHRTARLRLLACVLGVKFDDLRQREQERRNRHLLTLGFVMAALLCLMGGLTLFAFAQRSIARHEAVRANSEAAHASNEAAHASAAAAHATAEAARATEEAARANRATTRAIAGEEATQVRLAESTLLYAEALGREQNWQTAHDLAEEALGIYNRLGRPTFPADVALADIYRFAPPPLNLLRGESWPNSVALSPDGRTLLMASGELTLLDARTGSVLATFTAQAGDPFKAVRVAFLPDGRAVSADDNGTIRLWDVAARREIRTLRGHTQHIREISLSRDGRFLACADASETGPLRLWDLESGKTVQAFQLKGTARSLSLSPNADRLFATSLLQALLWDTRTGQLIRSSDYVGPNASLSIDPAGTGTFLTGNYVGGVSCRQVETGKELWYIQAHTDHANAVSFTPNGRMAVTGGGDGKLKVWSIATQKLLRFFSNGSASLNLMQVSADGRLLLSTSGHDAIVWELPPGSDELAFTDRGIPVKSVALSPDGLLAASESADARLSLWDAATGHVLAQCRGGSKNTRVEQQIALVGDGRSLLAGPSLYELLTGNAINAPNGREGYASAMSPDGRTVVTGGNGALYAWDPETGGGRRDFDSKGIGTVSVAFAPDGRHVVIGDSQGNVLFWDTVTGKHGPKIDVGGHFNVFAVAYSPDGRYVLAGGMGRGIKLVDVAAGKVIADLVGHTATVTRVAFSPDGLMAASTSEDGTLRLWNIATGRPVHTFAAHAGRANSLAFAADGRSVLTGGGDGFVREWDFARATTYREFTRRLEAARRAVDKADADHTAIDPETLKTFGEWYAFRRQWDWAASLLEEARAAGATVSPLLLARCNWQAGNLDAADREFTEAADQHEAPAAYVALCQQAVRAPKLQRQQLAAAVDEATQAIADYPNDAKGHINRAVLFASDGKFGDAISDFVAANKMQPFDDMILFRIACLRLYLGDTAGYRSECQQLMQQFGSSPATAPRAVKAAFLAPGSTDDLQRLIGLIDQRLAVTDPSNGLVAWYQLTKAMGEYRAGRFESALQWLSRIPPLNLTRDLTVSMFRAMADFQLGHLTEARDALTQATSRIDNEIPPAPPTTGDWAGNIENWLVCQIIRREAEALIEGRPPVFPVTQPTTPASAPASQPTP